MNKKTIYLRLIIRFIQQITIVLGFTLYYFVIQQQINETHIQLKKLYQGLGKNYIINVRPIDDQSQCNHNETSLSAFLQKYSESTNNLDYIVLGEENPKQIIKLCYETYYENNFLALKQQELINKEQHDCIYKGISFKSIEGLRSKCPISDIKFSTEESISNYEKIQIQNSNKKNLFIKRSDQNEVPLIGIYLSKENFEDKQIKQIENIQFSMDDICKKYYNQYQQACQTDSNSKQVEFNLYKETHLAIECDKNAEFLKQDPDGKLKFQNISCYYYYYEIFSYFFTFIALSFILLKQKEIEDDKKELTMAVIYDIMFLLLLDLSCFFKTLYYYKQKSTFSYAIYLLQGVSQFNEDLLKNIYEKAQVMNQQLTIIIWTGVIISLIDNLATIFSYSKKDFQFNGLEKYEMKKLN